MGDFPHGQPVRGQIWFFNDHRGWCVHDGKDWIPIDDKTTEESTSKESHSKSYDRAMRGI